jgi:hypothetical protein
MTDDELGTVYRVLYQDGTTALFTALDYPHEWRESQDLNRLPEHRIVHVDRFDAARWQREPGDFWVLTGLTDAGHRITIGDATHPETDTLPDRGDFDVHYDPETGTASIQAEYGDRPDLGDASAAEPVERHRLQQLADRIREWFQRDRDRGMGL